MGLAPFLGALKLSHERTRRVVMLIGNAEYWHSSFRTMGKPLIAGSTAFRASVGSDCGNRVIHRV
jgi:hypothetical protein